MAEKPAHLEPSKLGTKEYWDALYSTEIANHAHDPSDTGTAWFDDSDATERLVDFLEDAVENESEENDFGLDEARTATFLDLGTGNGSLLFGLRDAGWRGFMLGVDYSPLSVEFARRIERSRRRERRLEEEEDEEEEGNIEAEEEGKEKEVKDQEEKEGEEEGENVDVHFAEHDILRTPASAILDLGTKFSKNTNNNNNNENESNTPPFPGFDVVLDKGTFDAISLSAETIDDPATPSSTNTTNTTNNGTDTHTSPQPQKRRINEIYGSRVLPLVREGGLFLVTSCNWTESELRAWFEDRALSSQDIDIVNPTSSETQNQNQNQSSTDDNNNNNNKPYWGFQVVGRVEYPSFSFGGVKGQTISTLCFRKVRKGGSGQGR